MAPGVPLGGASPPMAMRNCRTAAEPGGTPGDSRKRIEAGDWKNDLNDDMLLIDVAIICNNLQYLIMFMNIYDIIYIYTCILLFSYTYMYIT